MSDVYITRGAGFSPHAMSALDANVQASIVRYIVALRYMLTGRLRDVEVPGLSIGAYFGIPEEVRYLFITSTAADAVTGLRSCSTRPTLADSRSDSR